MNTLLVRRYIRGILAEARRGQVSEEDAEAVLDDAMSVPKKPNKGNVAEGIVGATIVAKFLAGGDDIEAEDVWKVLKNLNTSENVNQSSEKKKKTTTVKKSYQYNLPSTSYATGEEKNAKANTINLIVGLAQNNFNDLVNPDYFESISGLVLAAIEYTSSPAVMNIINGVKEAKKSNFVEVRASGIEDQKGTKVDIFISVDGEPTTEYGKISLKANSKQLGQTGKSWRGTPEVLEPAPSQASTEKAKKAKKYTRGVTDLFKSLFGIDIDDGLETGYLEAFKKNTRIPVLNAVQEVYYDAFMKISDRLDFAEDSVELQDFLTILANGIKYEAVLKDEGVRLLKLGNGTFKLLNFNNLVTLFQDDEKEIDFEVSYGYSGEDGDGDLPKITISVAVDGVDYGPIISVRPKISPKNREDRNKPNFEVGEFRHYVEKESGLEKLIAVEFEKAEAEAEAIRT